MNGEHRTSFSPLRRISGSPQESWERNWEVPDENNLPFLLMKAMMVNTWGRPSFTPLPFNSDWPIQGARGGKKKEKWDKEKSVLEKDGHENHRKKDGMTRQFNAVPKKH